MLVFSKTNLEKGYCSYSADDFLMQFESNAENFFPFLYPSNVLYPPWNNSRAPDKVHIFISILPFSLPNPMINHKLESSYRDDSNKWSNIGFCKEITQLEWIEVHLTHLIWSSETCFYHNFHLTNSFQKILYSWLVSCISRLLDTSTGSVISMKMSFA